MRSWLVFEGPIRHALHTLKYRRNLALGDALAQELRKFVDQLGWKVDMVVPVPLGRQRLKERGYNQVGLVAMPLAALNGWWYSSNTLSRTRETRSQVGLSVEERRANVSGAFRAKPALADGKVILLMDDVATTGATLSVCAEALKQSGARLVYALTLARALPRHGLHVV
ncbi:MAG TPA: ComF family protein [Anaerolineales bacterium]|nr:ComF family protein [Anaerolineales bacterium]